MNKILLGGLLVASMSYAESSVYDLGQIEVTDTNDVSQNKTTVEVGKETIEETESTTAVEALQVVPGVIVQNTGKKNLMDIRLRGFDSKRVPIFIDGIPVYVPYNRETDLGRYTTYDLSEITLSKGYVSPMFGPNTLGGAVNLITRKPKKEFEGEAGAGVFSGNGKQEFLTLGTNQGTYYGLFSISNYSRDYFTISKNFKGAGREDGGRRENADSKDFKLNLKVGYTPNDTDEYSLNYIMQRAEKGNPFYASDYEGGDEGWKKGYRTRNWRWPDWDKTSYYFISKTAFKDLTVKTRIFYDKFYNKLQDMKWGWTSEYDDHTIGANAEFDYTISDSQILKIALFQKNDYHKDISSDDPGLDIEVEGKTRSIGLEHSWKINDKLKWVVGLAYDKSSVDKAEYRNDSGGISDWNDYDSDAFSPQTVLYYTLNEQTTLYGTLGKRNNMPSLSDRYSSSFGTSLPNPGLEAETATNYEIGVEHKVGYNHLLKSSLFLTKTDKYIAGVDVDPALHPTFCTGSYCTQYQNVGQAEYKGIEFSADSFWNDNLTTNFAYTYIDFKLKRSEADDVKYITGLPKHTLSFRANYKPMSKISIIPTIRYESDRYVDNKASSPTTRDFMVMDLKTTYEIKKGLTLSVGVKNIFDKYYYYSEGYPMAGRNYYATLRYLF